MCEGIIIDAHIMKKIRDELVLEKGQLYDIMCWIIQNCGIAISPQIEAHWRTKFKDGDFFWTWYSDQFIAQAMHPVRKIINIDSHVKKRIHNDYNLPNDMFIIGHIKCANSTCAPRYILADDILFYDPQAKSTTVDHQKQVMESRSGRLCRYLEEALKIRVGTSQDLTTHFSVGTGACASRPLTSASMCPKLP